jgi:hypothetical protein
MVRFSKGEQLFIDEFLFKKKDNRKKKGYRIPFNG